MVMVSYRTILAPPTRPGVRTDPVLSVLHRVLRFVGGDVPGCYVNHVVTPSQDLDSVAPGLALDACRRKRRHLLQFS